MRDEGTVGRGSSFTLALTDWHDWHVEIHGIR